jgi:hypothetical protein
MRLRRSISGASGRSPAAASSTGTRPKGRSRPARRRYASIFANSPTRSNARPCWTRPTGVIPTSTRCRCTASSSRSRTRSTPKTCARRPGVMPPTTSISRRATMCSSSNCAARGRSSSPRPSAPNTTAGPATRAAGMRRKRCCPRCWAISAAAGAATRRTLTIPRAPRRWARAPGPACPSAPISSWRASARKPAPRHAARPTTMQWR